MHLSEVEKQRVLDRVTTQAKAVKRPLTRANLLIRVSQLYRRIKAEDLADGLLVEALRVADNVRQPEKSVILAEAACSLASEGLWDRAEQLFSSAEDAAMDVRWSDEVIYNGILHCMARSYCDYLFYGKAVALCDLLPRQDQKDPVLKTVYDKYIGAGKIELACEMISKMGDGPIKSIAQANLSLLLLLKESLTETEKDILLNLQSPASFD